MRDVTNQHSPGSRLTILWKQQTIQNKAQALSNILHVSLSPPEEVT